MRSQVENLKEDNDLLDLLEDYLSPRSLITDDKVELFKDNELKPIDLESLTKIEDDKVEVILTSKRNEQNLRQDSINFIDEEWVTNMFMVKAKYLTDDLNFLRFSSSAIEKFTDTSLGGSFSLNVIPQFTRYADPRVPGKVISRNKVKVGEFCTNIGMGRYYSEAIDDNATRVYLQFGVPEFNNILSYLLSAVDYEKAVVANSGRSPFFFKAGKLMGIGAMVLAFPIITPLILIGKFALESVMAFTGYKGRFEQYYLKETMNTYWSAVNSIVTMIATEMGILDDIFLDNEADRNKLGVPTTLDKESVKYLRELFGNVVTEGNIVNVQAMVSKAQIRHAKYLEAKKLLLDTLTAMDAKQLESNLEKRKDIQDYIDNNILEMLRISGDETSQLWEDLRKTIPKDDRFKPIEKNRDLKAKVEALKKEVESKKEELTKLYQPDEKGRYYRKIRPEDDLSFIERVLETMKAEALNGGRYAIFQVDHIESVSESFNNSVTNIDLNETLNSYGKKWRSFKFDLGLADVPIVSDVIKYTTDFIAGNLDGITLGFSNVVATFLSGAQIQVPKRWEDSTVSLPSLNFKMSLRSPYAHPYAQLRNIYIPLAAILAGVLPLSTGPRSYTSPFLCSLYVKGMQTIKLGMITSLTITRGTSNLPYNKQRRPLAIDVSFSVTDFSDLLTTPMPNSPLDVGSVMYDDEAGLNRYIQALVARDLNTTIHVYPKFKTNLSRFFQNLKLTASPEYIGSKVMSTIEDVPLVGTLAELYMKNKHSNYTPKYNEY